MLMVMHIHGRMVKLNRMIRNEIVFCLDRLWRKTRSPTSNPQCFGADPNRNWDYQWCEGNFCSAFF